MTRNLESRLQRLEQQRQVPHDARECTDAELLRILRIGEAAFVRMANSVDAKDQEPPDDCTPAEREVWHYLRDVLHFDKLPF
ncbi:conserved hypothetical protein [Thiomonas arsenitoxydans]|uniref:Uncharacterized protein n=1 Tax=Thiomonas arsenitoxydans (strain DSM 22701 / CIP 110005 / 3As) TaxID=426114 RepID=D6CLC7_THIA3|nr:hypothetical protein [Thiomonas arsenitoxydans]CAZ89355.1 hypothetical protein THI_2742 [Thiomonas arsenitoxydans]CQR33867.1 conserved hypothetical protein [Thiomonas arsenitoxydans]CQR35553.1 conserved hypothetical protein [Thiomonas arsenitoxydans]CQR37785.1 conserved hypothetical protein [Thiomonas arsenitoxydans]CQR37928.1 conserved hypothetical protein [Thiomonas arsenitoxydans]